MISPFISWKKLQNNTCDLQKGNISLGLSSSGTYAEADAAEATQQMLLAVGYLHAHHVTWRWRSHGEQKPWEKPWEKRELPSGKHTKSYWKWPFIVIFHSYVKLPEGMEELGGKKKGERWEKGNWGSLRKSQFFAPCNEVCMAAVMPLKHSLKKGMGYFLWTPSYMNQIWAWWNITWQTLNLHIN